VVGGESVSTSHTDCLGASISTFVLIVRLMIARVFSYVAREGREASALVASALDLPSSASRMASLRSAIATVAMRSCRSPMPSMCLDSAGVLTSCRSVSGTGLTGPMPVSSASSAPKATSSAVLTPALGTAAFCEERQDGPGDLLWVLGVGVVACVVDHFVLAEAGR